MSKDTPSDAPGGTPSGDRIAKVLARAGVASRRDAERMIEAGRVTVNGEKITRAALNVSPKDTITVDGKPISEPEPERLWLYHKPAGLVTSDRDEKGRKTIYEDMPEDLPRVMCVGRLDINSEGLLLLTNDGGIKRKLELPSTGWLRRYRVRINGRPTDETFAPLRRGITVDNEIFQPMQIQLDRQQGANAWLTVGLREGKNREIRRAMQDIGLSVNRLIRISYGPFQLGDLKPGAVEEIRRKVMRDQLGMEELHPNPEGTAQKKQVKRERKEPISRKPSEQGRTRNMARSEAERKAAKARPERSERPDGKTFGKPFGRPTGKPMGRPTGKPTGKPTGRPVGRPTGKPKR